MRQQKNKTKFRQRMEKLFIYLFKKSCIGLIQKNKKLSNAHFAYLRGSKVGVGRSTPSEAPRVEVPTVKASEWRPIVRRVTMLDEKLREVTASTAQGSAGRSNPWLLRKVSIASGYLGAAIRFPSSYLSLYFLNLKTFISHWHWSVTT